MNHGFDESFFDLPPGPLSGPGPGPRPWDPPLTLRPNEISLARTPAVEVSLSGFVALPSGFAFFLNIRWADPNHRPVRNVFDVVLELGEPIPDSPPPTMLRFGVAYSDGSKSTNLDGKWDLPAPQQPPVLYPGSWYMSDTSAMQSFWIWPLPPPGPLSFVLAWPLETIPLTVAQVDAESIVGDRK